MNKHKKKQDLDLIQSSDTPTCDTHLVHLDNVRSSQAQILPTDKAQQMAEIFGVLADTNRIRLLSALASSELCVCDLAALTKMSESAVCHQLRLLKAMRLVSYRREGRNVYYSLADSHVINLYRSLVENNTYATGTG
ncbi:ArsR/SmtB family transcription factor (plasmid) [Anabaena sp. FACHB-709]|uniref:Transcription repressor SmtB n=3 Tax=Nostocaceae TaxID=1162 RepID=A0A1Z4KVZ3_ANAVA|nr:MULTISPECIES: metalloregulator ArsR/SmtB family transcription factor [Nostocaceae]BAY73097.1 transcription repressor SmtB [Trichormus variabilis NIES-23]HBW31223.1 transcriptional regulator [Nostoc sp. UBA8866]MBD2172964.1 helix-turn-helix transcriptional regulator [Anabaena cylindrica FACHB-318]MBD2264705.1 helix-turn-helix transcriptional regulator [Anabaena sp. FACHB-709]MBD2273946.1 helix-turn-helix transcriptional regulator [Nostoc sp. PCC 7120 = FACHB-418]